MDQSEVQFSSNNKMAFCFPVVFDQSMRSSFKRRSSSSRSTSSLKDGSKLKKSPVICFGELLNDFVPTVAGVSLAEAAGFKNPVVLQLMWLFGISRLEGSAAFFLGKLGEDEFRHMLASILKQHDVDNSGMRFDTHARTAFAFVDMRADGECEFMFFQNPSI